MKNFNGSDCTFNQHGSITELKDSDGRTWKFSYAQDQVIEFINPFGHSFIRKGNAFIQTQGSIEPAPSDIIVDHNSGTIKIIDSVRVTTYMPDGSTVINLEQVRNGGAVRVCFTEYATKPNRAFVVVEEKAEQKQVTWIQDANAKLFQFEYDEKNNLCRYTDVSSKPGVVWSVVAAANGKVTAWAGHEKANGKEVGAMSPTLESVDNAGNRHFIRHDGMRFAVGPSGGACISSQICDEAIAGEVPVVAFGNLEFMV